MFGKLTEIPLRVWPNLRELYKKDWPSHALGYYTIDNYIKWFEKEPDIKNIKVFTLNGDWSDGTYVIVDRYHITFNTLNEDHNRLIAILSLLDYLKRCVFNAYPSALQPSVDKFLGENNLGITRLGGSKTIWYYLPKEAVRKFEISLPEGITLKSLKEEHAQIANDEWPFRHDGSLYFIKRLIKLNPSIGAFTKDDELVAWCFRLQIGSLGILQVKESHKRKGLGRMIVKAMCQLFAKMDSDVLSPVVDDNLASRNLFQNLGFEMIDNVYWSVLETTGTTEWKDEFDM